MVNNYKKGWYNESKRHALAAKGIKTGNKVTNLHKNIPIGEEIPDEYDRLKAENPYAPERDSFGFEIDPYGRQEEEQEAREQNERERKAIEEEYKSEYKAKPKKYWIGEAPKKDDFGEPISDEFIDGKTVFGAWGFMTPKTFKEKGVGLGLGLGQRYRKTASGWEKVEG